MKTIGELLKEERKEKKISLEEISQRTKIRVFYLKAIEANDFESLPSPACAKGFIKNYAQYLGISPVRAVAIFKRDFGKQKGIKIALETPKELSARFVFSAKFLPIAVFVFLALVLLGFLIFKLFSLTSTPYA